VLPFCLLPDRTALPDVGVLGTAATDGTLSLNYVISKRILDE